MRMHHFYHLITDIDSYFRNVVFQFGVDKNNTGFKVIYVSFLVVMLKHAYLYCTLQYCDEFSDFRVGTVS